jgi:hypothetical protein
MEKEFEQILKETWAELSNPKIWTNDELALNVLKYGFLRIQRLQMIEDEKVTLKILNDIGGK